MLRSWKSLGTSLALPQSRVEWLWVHQWSCKVGLRDPIWMRRRLGWPASKGLSRNGVTAPHKCILLWGEGSHHHWMGRESQWSFLEHSEISQNHTDSGIFSLPRSDHLTQDVQEMPHILFYWLCLRGHEILKSCTQSLWTGLCPSWNHLLWLY